MADLHWLPYDVDQWEERTRELSLEQEGALMRLLRHAWADQDPCTIADSDAAFDRVLGSKWKKLLPLVREHFTPAEGKPGRLRCAWLFALYEHQLRKHESYQNRGKKGGRPKSAESSAKSPASKKAAQNKSSAKAQSRENTAEGNNSGPLRDHRVITPPASALALEAAHAAGEPSDEHRAESSVVSAQEIVAAEQWLATQPDVAAAIDYELAAEPINIADPNVLAGVASSRDRVHTGRLGSVLYRFRRTALVVAKYRTREAVSS